jgi:hypothetical protein
VDSEQSVILPTPFLVLNSFEENALQFDICIKCIYVKRSENGRKSLKPLAVQPRRAQAAVNTVP